MSGNWYVLLFCSCNCAGDFCFSWDMIFVLFDCSSSRYSQKYLEYTLSNTINFCKLRQQSTLHLPRFSLFSEVKLGGGGVLSTSLCSNVSTKFVFFPYCFKPGVAKVGGVGKSSTRELSSLLFTGGESKFIVLFIIGVRVAGCEGNSKDSGVLNGQGLWGCSSWGFKC